MKTLPITRPILALLLLCLPLRAEDEIEKAFRDALYAEEVKGDTEAALKAYAEVAAKFEQQRDMAATALFRQAECLRKLGRKDEAAAMYKKVLAQYGDKERSAKLSRENLAALGMVPDAASPEAASTGDASEVARLEKLLKDSPDLINATDATNPLTAAAEKGQVALVDYLLGKGARVDTLVDGRSALHRAAEAGHLTVCQKLIEKGADVNLKTDKEATALLLALDKGRFSIVELLLEKKADLNAGKHYVFNPGKSQTVGTNNGIQTVTTEAERSETRYTLSLALARKAPAALVLRLIKEGAEPAAVSVSLKDRMTTQTLPLAEAIRLRDASIVEAILAKGFSPAQKVDEEGRNSGSNVEVWAMDLAMQQAAPSAPEAADDPIVELLRKHGADLKREQVMDKAIEKGLTGYIRAAVKDGASPNRLANAIEAEKYDALKVLLEAGADPAGEQTEYGDPMTAAVYKGSAEAVKTLLDAGYPLKDRLVKVTSVAAWGAFPADGKPNAAARAIYEQMAGEAKKAGVLEEALTKTLTRMLDYSNPPMDTAALLAAGANAAKSEPLSKLFQDQGSRYGLSRSDYMDLWKAARITQNPELRTAVWVSRGPSMFLNVIKDNAYFQRGQPNHQTFFRSIIQEKGIVPPGTLGRVLAAYGWNADSHELTRLTVYRLDAEGKVQAHAVDFTAIARGGDASKDFPMQWGDVVEIPLRYAIPPGSDSLAEKTRREERESVSKFMDGLFSTIDVRLSIGDDQWVVNERNEKGPVLRLGTSSGILGEAGIPGAFSPAAVLKFSAPGVGESDFSGPPSDLLSNYPGHGGSVRMEPPAREAALSDEALRNAFTLAVSEKGPYLRAFPEAMQDLLVRFEKAYPGAGRGRELLALRNVEPVSDPFEASKVASVMDAVPTRSLRDVLLMLHGPNLTGFGPVNWPAAKLRLAMKDGWEDLTLDKADLNWPIVPGMMLILPPLDPAAPIPPDTFDYAACAFDFEITPGDMPPVKLRYQPPVPELKREGDKWLWSWKRKEGDAAFGWPDLYSLLSSVPELKDWPQYKITAKLTGGAGIVNDSDNLRRNGGLWLQWDWTDIRVEKAAPPPAIPRPVGIPGGLQIPTNAVPGGQPVIPNNNSNPTRQGRTRVVLPPPLPGN